MATITALGSIAVLLTLIITIWWKTKWSKSAKISKLKGKQREIETKMYNYRVGSHEYNQLRAELLLLAQEIRDIERVPK